MAERSESASIADLERRVRAHYASVPAAEVSAAIDAAMARFEASQIRDFIPLLIERRVIAHLQNRETENLQRLP